MSPPRATVTLAELSTTAEVRSEEPVFRGEWAVSPAAERPAGLLVHREISLDAELLAATAADPAGVPVPIDPRSAGIVVDGHTELVRVVTWVVEQGRYLTSMHTSRDLAQWTSIELDAAIDRHLVAAGDGLLAAAQRDGEMTLWEVAEDGTATALAPVTVPEGERWRITHLARQEQSVLLTVDRDGVEGPSIAVVSSADGGASWSAAATLPGAQADDQVREVLAVAGTFVLIGVREMAAEWDSSATYTRPVAWSGSGADDLAPEEIPLPTWGLEGYSSELRGDLSRDSPVDFADLDLGLSVRSADGQGIIASTFFADDARRLDRAADGTWSTASPGRFALHMIYGIVQDDSGTLYRVHNRLLGQQAETAGPTEGLVAARPRSLDVTTGAVGAGLVGEVTWERPFLLRSEQWIRWSRVTDRLVFGVHEDDTVVQRRSPSLGSAAHMSARIHQLAEGLTLYTGVLPEDDGVTDPGLTAVVSGDLDDWTGTTGIPRPEPGTQLSYGTASTIDGVHYFPLAVAGAPGSDSEEVLVPGVYSSVDGITWESVPPPVPAHPDPEAMAHGAQITQLTSRDGVLIALGHVQDAEDRRRPVTFVQEGEQWRTVPLEDAPPDTSIRGTGDDGIDGSGGGRSLRWSLGADGTLTETYRSDDRGSRGPAIDLGEGALVAGGWIDSPAGDAEVEQGVGACLWASRDNGENWWATMIPGQDGRYPEVTPLADGKDLLVIVDDSDAPRGYRVLDARADVLGTEEDG